MPKNAAKNSRIQREKLRRSNDILQAARKVMLAKSYTGATMDDIAAAAGLTKPTIYQYFRTKDELFAGLMAPLIVDFEKRLQTIREEIESGIYRSGRDVVHDVYNLYYDMFETDPEMFSIFNIFLQIGMKADMNSEAMKTIKDMGRRCFNAGHSIVSASVSRKLFREMDIYHTTDFVWGSFWGIVQVEQNRWGKEGISPFLKPVFQHGEELLIRALVRK